MMHSNEEPSNRAMMYGKDEPLNTVWCTVMKNLYIQ